MPGKHGKRSETARIERQRIFEEKNLKKFGHPNVDRTAADQQLAEVQAQMRQMVLALQQCQDRATRAEAALAQSIAVPTSSAQRQRPQGLELVDAKLLSKPKVFGGKEDEWAQWAFKMLAYVGALDGEMLDELTAASAEAVVSNVANSRLSAAGQERRRQLYYILI